MNALFTIADQYVPRAVKRHELRNLIGLTAMAFATKAPDTDGMTYDECLLAYARFTTATVADGGRRDEVPGVVRDRLYRNAYTVGHWFRHFFGVQTFRDAMAVARILYRILGIDFHANENGEISIAECFFSQFYSPETCRMISALDEGLLSGLSGGGRLMFSQRITEGCLNCKAQFFPKECQSEKSNRRR